MPFARLGTRRTPPVKDAGGFRDDFPHLSAGQVYLDSACQSLRPEPVIDAITRYYREYGACGDRGAYPWARQVGEGVADAREAVIAAFDLPPRRYTCAFTLNTTYGLHLLLSQLPIGRYSKVVTSHAEHNSVFLATMSFARRAGVSRVVAYRGLDGIVDLDGIDLAGALVVLSAMDNVTGTYTANLDEIIGDVRRAGGAVIVDAAQAAPHALSRLRGIHADAVCLSAHKMYGPSLGVVVATDELLASLELTFVGGGQVASVREGGFTLLPSLHTRLEPGLQAYGEIIGFAAALEWLRPRMARVEAEEYRLGRRLYEGIAEMPNLTLVGAGPSAVLSAVPQNVDAHRLAVFLAKAGISVRSGHFCANHWLEDTLALPPLVRFSLGAHTTEADVDRAIDVVGRMMRGL